MKINTLYIENFRCFKHYEVSLAPRFTLFIGDNGRGKTAVLDALAVAAGSFFLGVTSQGVVSRNIQRDDVRLRNLWVGQSLTSEVEGPTTVGAEGVVEGHPFRWSRSLTSLEGRTTRQDAKPISKIATEMSNLVKRGGDVTLPVIAYFGSGRLYQNLRDRSVTVGAKNSRFAGYHQCLNPASDPKRLFRWFKTNELAALQKRETRHVLEAVRAAILSIVPSANKVFWDVDWDELVIVLDDGQGQRSLPFHLLSDGYRALIGLAADISYRMATLNPHLLEDAANKTPGMVLIDEVDVHLHPKWQRVVVGALLSTFPKVQFVATTHSPFIIQDIQGVPGTLLWDLNTGRSLPLESKSIEDIAENKQGVEVPQQSQRYLSMMESAEKYYALLREAENADPVRLVELRIELDHLSMPYSDDPAYQAFLNQQRLAARIDGDIQP